MSLTKEQPHPASTPTQGATQAAQSGGAAMPQPMEDDEAQMRRALGLFGEPGRTRPDGERQDLAPRGGGFMQNMHRRRFVQDGDIPVTVVRRDTPDTTHAGAAPSNPTSSRLQRVEIALQTETAARERAERALHDTQAALQALQTKIGHNDLAKAEAVAASKRHLDEVVTLREELAANAESLREAEARASETEDDLRGVRAELHEERRARKLAERLAAEAAEGQDPTDEQVDVAAYSSPVRQDIGEPVRVPARRGRPPLVRPEPDTEAEPVKWWLAPAKTAAKKR